MLLYTIDIFQLPNRTCPAKPAHKMSNAHFQVAELLLTKGLSSLVKHRSDDERSSHYEALLEAEAIGRKNQRVLTLDPSAANPRTCLC